MTDRGLAYSWGKNNQGQCGHLTGLTGGKADEEARDSTDILVPTLIDALRGPPDAPPSSRRIVQMAGGWEHTLALSKDGTVFSFGAGAGHDALQGHLNIVT